MQCYAIRQAIHFLLPATLSKPFSVCMQSHVYTKLRNVHRAILLQNPFASGMLRFSSLFLLICIWNRCYLCECRKIYFFFPRLWTWWAWITLCFVSIPTIECFFAHFTLPIYHSIISYPASISLPSGANKKVFSIGFYLFILRTESISNAAFTCQCFDFLSIDSSANHGIFSTSLKHTHTYAKLVAKMHKWDRILFGYY